MWHDTSCIYLVVAGRWLNVDWLFPSIHYTAIQRSEVYPYRSSAFSRGYLVNTVATSWHEHTRHSNAGAQSAKERQQIGGVNS
jgi:hypothetical protein